MKNSHAPVARKEGLVIQESSDELLVYDLRRDKAHCLNQTAAFVWRSCDGNNSIQDITRRFEKDLGMIVDDDFVWLALDQLGGKNLLEQNIEIRFRGQTRREVIKRIGLAAVVAMPVVASLAVPRSAMAAATCACINNGDCLTQTGCPSTTNCTGSGFCAPA